MSETAATTEIAEYSVTTAALAALKVGLTGKVYAVDNATGMALAKFDRRGLVTLRTDLEKKRLELNKDDQGRITKRNSEAKRITGELLELETPIDDQIKVEEAKKEEEKAEKARLAAIAQKALDDMIIMIGMLPSKCTGKDSVWIGTFLATLEAKEFGGEFVGDTRARAGAARTEAVTAIQKQLAATIWTEGQAATLKAEQEAEAVRLEAERIENERLAALEREEIAARQLELDEQKRLQDIEAARLAELAATETERLRVEREAFETEQATAKAEQVEIDRLATEKQTAIDAEEKRVKDEAAAALLETERQAAIVTEAARKKTEMERKAAEKARKLAEAKCADAATAFKKIYGLCNNGSDRSQADVLCEISDIAESMI